MRRPTEWFRQSLESWERSLEAAKKNFEITCRIHMDSIQRQESGIAKLKAQVERAENEGRVEFDDQKFNVRRKP